MSFINERFMINNEAGRWLYSHVAKALPIIDYHCHLNAQEIYENKAFDNISQLWLAGDHYKWRAMRANGIAEKFITGDATAEEKFNAWAETVESCFGNPLYHWTHLELHYYFGCNRLLDSQNWRSVMDQCNALISGDDFRPRALISRSNVEVICTTDAPLDDLKYHRLINADESFKTKVLPTFRPDAIFESDAATFSQFIDALGQMTNNRISTFSEFENAISQRIDWFHESGCRISDHGPTAVIFRPAGNEVINTIFCRKRQGETLAIEDAAKLDSALYLMLAREYKKRGWAMQIHFGAIRSNNSRMRDAVGINAGYDSINDQTDLAASLNPLLDAMAQADALPKTIIYNLNASYNDVVATSLANFQSNEHGVKSPMQFGSGWWFNDTRRGMENQLNCLADQGLLMNFIGMLTDSRSLVSYTRHDYFRRILCNLIGDWVEKGEVPDNKEILSLMIKNICHDNAERYFKFA
nr:glucuronate isomerase [uncultured Enterobacter sp.]